MRIEDALLRCKEVSIRNSDTPGLDSRVLIAHLTGRPQSWVLAHPDDIFPPDLEAKLSKALSQLKAGIPLPYVLGEWEFYNLTFEIRPDVLIPRPETEILVEEALTWLKARPGARQAADIGTGSGCIAISLAHEVSDLEVIATDISESALTIAQSNAVRHRVNDRIQFVHANLLEALTPPAQQVNMNGFDLIVANLPYIPTDVLPGLKVFQHEPLTALDGGQDGLDLIRKLLDDLPQVLKPGSLILFEIEANQGKNAIELTQAQFPNAEVSLHLDLSGHDRLVRIQT